MHPHDNCLICQANKIWGKTGGENVCDDIDATSLFHWLMHNFSESKQVIVERLLRDYNITKKGNV